MEYGIWNLVDTDELNIFECFVDYGIQDRKGRIVGGRMFVVYNLELDAWFAGCDAVRNGKQYGRLTRSTPVRSRKEGVIVAIQKMEAQKARYVRYGV